MPDKLLTRRDDQQLGLKHLPSAGNEYLLEANERNGIGAFRTTVDVEDCDGWWSTGDHSTGSSSQEASMVLVGALGSIPSSCQFIVGHVQQ